MSDDFHNRYRLLKCIALEDQVRSHNAQEVATGRVVMVHLLDDAGPSEISALRAKLDRLHASDKSRVLELAVLTSGFAVVTDFLPGFSSLPGWLATRGISATDNRSGAAGAASSARTLPAESNTAPPPVSGSAPQSPPGATASSTGRDEVTAPMPVMAPPAMPPGTPERAADISVPAAPVPGEFTKLFAAPPAPAPPPPLPPSTGAVRSGASATGAADAADAAVGKPAPSAPPAPAAQPGEFTSMFAVPPAQAGPPAHTAPPVAPAPPASPPPLRPPPQATPPAAPTSPPGAPPLQSEYSAMFKPLAVPPPPDFAAGSSTPSPTAKAPAPVTPSAPVAPATPPAPAFPAAPAAPAFPSAAPGEFTQLFKQGSMGGGSSAPSQSTPSSPSRGQQAQSPFGFPSSQHNQQPFAPTGSSSPANSDDATGVMRAMPSAPAPSASPTGLGATSFPPSQAMPPAAAATSPAAPVPPKQPGIPPMLPPPMFGASVPPPTKSADLSPVSASSSAAGSAAPSEYTQMIRQVTPPPPAVEKPAAAPVKAQPPARKTPVALIIALNVIVVLAIALILYFVLRPSPPENAAPDTPVDAPTPVTPAASA